MTIAAQTPSTIGTLHPLLETGQGWRFCPPGPRVFDAQLARHRQDMTTSLGSRVKKGAWVKGWSEVETLPVWHSVTGWCAKRAQFAERPTPLGLWDYGGGLPSTSEWVQRLMQRTLAETNHDLQLCGNDPFPDKGRGT